MEKLDGQAWVVKLKVLHKTIRSCDLRFPLYTVFTNATGTETAALSESNPVAFSVRQDTSRASVRDAPPGLYRSLDCQNWNGSHSFLTGTTDDIDCHPNLLAPAGGHATVQKTQKTRHPDRFPIGYPRAFISNVEKKMIASLKVAKVVHLALLKLATAKSVIGVGVLVGSAATGLVATDILGPDYITGAAVLINQAVDAEGGLPAAVPHTRDFEMRSAIDGETATAGVP